MHFIDELDLAATLAAAGSLVHQRRALDIEDLLLALRWADLHGEDPQRVPGAVPVRCGGDHLVQMGGEGTPMVQDLCVHEFAIAHHTHPISARKLIADALDARHRLPITWTVFLDGGCEGWVIRKVATLTRDLTAEQAALVDAAVAAAIATEAPGRVLRIAEAKVIEADTAAHAAALEAKRRARHVSFTASDEHGLRHLIAHLEAGDAVWLDAVIDRLADLLGERRDLIPDLPGDCSKDELRAVALGWLARPEDAYALLTGTYPTPEQPAAVEPETEPVEPNTTRSTRQQAVVYVHLHQAAIDGIASGVARVEDVGALLLAQLRELLGHTNITLAPLIDLNRQISVNSYEHPEAVKERTHLRMCGEVFPHAVSQTRRTDTDHPSPYTPNGPPGQTGDHNAAHLRRSNHRAKTHKGYRLTQLGPGEYLWTTPHGLHRLVNTHGTHDIDEQQARTLEHPNAMDAALDRLQTKLDAGELRP
ncbi:hypothetical protein [Nocardioides sp.]|uniref:hypothetical protein n=1 Tax=Nocardioides sp. TaxID=35761 RepID=UPI0031FE9717|nr:hypothetical protein [Nocardioides sp.]